MDTLDRNVLDQLGQSMGGGGAVKRILSMYLGKLPGEATVLHQTAEDGDMDALAAESHRLKSSTAMLGATRLAEILAGMEAAAKAGDADLAAARLIEFDGEREKVEREMRTVDVGADA